MAEGRRIDGWKPIELRLDLLEPAAKLLPIDEASFQHLSHVSPVLRVPTLNLRERLRVEVVVVEREAALASDEDAPLLPAGKLGDELVRSRELDIDFELLLEPGKARKIRSDSGSTLTSTSSVLGLQPMRTAVAPPVK